MTSEQLKKAKYLLKWKVNIKRIAWEVKCSVKEIEQIKNNKITPPKTKPKVRHKNYYTYINSAEWNKRRIQKLKSTNYKCEICKGPASQVHHKHYKTLYKENMNDLQSLCGRCHKNEHNIPTELDQEFLDIII